MGADGDLPRSSSGRTLTCASFGDGRTREVLSVIISNWDVPGTFVNKPARECSRDEIQAEVWAQLKAHVNATRPPDV